MISFLIAFILILLIIAIKLLKGTIYATQKAGEIAFFQSKPIKRNRNI